MTIDGSVFFARMTGYVDRVDASTWADMLVTCAQNRDVSIMAVVDMLEVDRLCPTMVQMCEITLDQANVLGLVVVTGAAMTPRNARVLDELNRRVYKTFIAAGIEIPYPKQDVYVKELPRQAEDA